MGALALSWAAGNLVVKRMARYGPVAPLALVGWGNVSSLLAFALLALALHGPQGVWRQVSGLNAAGWISVLYLAWIAGRPGHAAGAAGAGHRPAGGLGRAGRAAQRLAGRRHRPGGRGLAAARFRAAIGAAPGAGLGAGAGLMPPACRLLIFGYKILLTK